MHKASVYFVVPARGGSKGIRKKNLLPIGGIPLVARAVTYGLQCKNVDQVFASSDCEQILTTAQTWGASAHRRSQSASSDNASTEDFLLDFLSAFSDDPPEFIVYAQPTTPFLDATEIDTAISWAQNDGSIDTVFSAKKTHNFIWRLNDDGSYSGVNHNPHEQRARRQDSHALDCIEDGGFYVVRTSRFLETRNRFGGNNVALLSNLPPFPEIDELRDYYYLCALSPYLENLYDCPLSRARLLFSDFDGVMTDDSVSIDQHGNEQITCSRLDGIGVDLLKQLDIETIIISAETNPVVKRRAEKLGIECHFGTKNKLETIKNICREKGLERTQTAFVGNEVNDKTALQWVGCPLITKDAATELLSYGFHVVPCNGGQGVIREIARRCVNCHNQQQPEPNENTTDL